MNDLFLLEHLMSWPHGTVLPSIHPSIFYNRLNQFRVVGELEPIPAVTGQKARYTVDGLH